MYVEVSDLLELAHFRGEPSAAPEEAGEDRGVAQHRARRCDERVYHDVPF